MLQLQPGLENCHVNSRGKSDHSVSKKIDENAHLAYLQKDISITGSRIEVWYGTDPFLSKFGCRGGMIQQWFDIIKMRITQ